MHGQNRKSSGAGHRPRLLVTLLFKARGSRLDASGFVGSLFGDDAPTAPAKPPSAPGKPVMVGVSDFEEHEHPRAQAGTAEGGRFVAKPTSGDMETAGTAKPKDVPEPETDATTEPKAPEKAEPEKPAETQTFAYGATEHPDEGGAPRGRLKDKDAPHPQHKGGVVHYGRELSAAEQKAYGLTALTPDDVAQAKRETEPPAPEKEAPGPETEGTSGETEPASGADAEKAQRLERAHVLGSLVGVMGWTYLPAAHKAIVEKQVTPLAEHIIAEHGMDWRGDPERTLAVRDVVRAGLARLGYGLGAADGAMAALERYARTKARTPESMGTPGTYSPEDALASSKPLSEHPDVKMDASGKHFLDEGARVVLPSGRLGTVTKHRGYTFSIGSAQVSKIHDYDVQTDRGAVVQVGGRVELRTPADINMKDDGSPDPIDPETGGQELAEDMWSGIAWARRGYKQRMDASERARHPARIKEHRDAAESYRKSAIENGEALLAWARSVPAETLTRELPNWDEETFLQEHRRLTGEARQPAARAPQQAGGPQVQVPVPSGGVTVNHNVERDGVEVKFGSRPPQPTIDALKARGFRWSKYQALWYARHTPERMAYAQELAGVQKAFVSTFRWPVAVPARLRFVLGLSGRAQ